MAYLVVLVKPEEGEIGNSNGFPVVLYLFACAIDNVCNFICHHKLQVLQEAQSQVTFMKLVTKVKSRSVQSIPSKKFNSMRDRKN